MGAKNKTLDPIEAKAAHWRELFDKQRLLLRSIVSLLNKYGSCLDLQSLYREFALTLMGQYMVADACYFASSHSSESLEPAVAYGRLPIDRLQPIGMTSPLVTDLALKPSVRDLDKMSDSVFQDPALEPLKRTMKVMGPVYVEDTLVGLIFLGSKVSGKLFTEFDVELLQTLCSASAVTFNNARLFENVKSSMDEVQKLSDLRNEMINRISHEFRTPITAIRGCLGFLPDSGMPPEMSEALVGSVDRLQELIDSLLKLNTISGAGTPVRWERLNPAAAIYEFLSAHSEQISGRSLTFDIRESPDLGTLSLRVTGQEYALVTGEILENAVRFSNENSAIGVTLSVLSREPDEAVDGVLLADWRDTAQKTMDDYKNLVTGGSSGTTDENVEMDEKVDKNHPTQTYLVVQVRNEGIGIPKKELEFIGEPFRQASNSPDQQIKGKALGLAVVHKMLTDCKGHLCCKSEENVATTFSLFIPLV